MDIEEKNNTETAEEAPQEVAPEEVTPEEVAPEEAPKKHRYADKLSKAYPDKKFESDEDIDKTLDEYLADLESYKEKGKAASKKLVNLFESEPQVGEVVRDMLNGSTFREALARHISPEDLQAIEGDPDYEGWTKNKSAREESIAKRRQFEDEYAKNISTSEQAITAFLEKRGMDEAAADEFFAKFDAMLTDINNGNISEEHLQSIAKAFSYDNDVLAATDQGRIAGRNENIVAQKEASPVIGDGMPRPNKAADEITQTATKPNYMDDLVNKTRKRDVFA